MADIGIDHTGAALEKYCSRRYRLSWVNPAVVGRGCAIEILAVVVKDAKSVCALGKSSSDGHKATSSAKCFNA